MHMVKFVGSQLCAALVISLVAVAGAQDDVLFSEGQSVVALVSLNVRDSPGVGNASFGVQSVGSHAVVVSSAPVELGGMLWWHLRWEDGVVGWSAQGDAGEAFLAVASSTETRTGAVRSVFAERWLRVFRGPLPVETPRFNGPVAVVTRTSSVLGQVRERSAWQFNEQGWPIAVEQHLYSGEATHSFTITWSYGSGGLPTSIHWRSKSDSVTLEFTWGPTAVEVSSAVFSARYFESSGGTLTVEQSFPIEMKQIYAFQADGSYTARISAPFDGTWQNLGVSTSDAQNVVIQSESEIVTNTTSVSRRDTFGNPTSASTRTRGQLSYFGELTWEIEYR